MTARSLLAQPTLRVALLGILAVVVAAAVICAYFALEIRAYDVGKSRATATVDGVVVEDRIGANEGIRVRWTDSRGRVHVQWFGTYYPDDHRPGMSFGVAYDPGAEQPTGYASDPDNDVKSDDLYFGAEAAVVVAVCLLGAWGFRGWWWRRGMRRASRPMTVVAYAAHRAMLPTSWLRLQTPSPDPEHTPTGILIRWQGVMWHPALDELSGPIDVLVKGDVNTRRRVVVELPDGTLLWPRTRLRRREPRQVVERDAVREPLTAAFVVPAAGVLRPADSGWWRVPLLKVAIAGVIGAVIGAVLTSGAGAIVASAAAAAGIAAFIWSFSGGEPRR